MLSKLTALLCCLFVGLAAYLGASQEHHPKKVLVRLVDGGTGKPVSGIVRLRAAGEQEALKIPELLDRLRGLRVPAAFAGWHVVPATGAEVTLPASELVLEAVSGLETALTREHIDLRNGTPAEVRVKLRFLFRPEQSDLVAGNTHLHLQKLTLEQADDYLRQIPEADNLRVLFISYLERHEADREYITNKYPIGDLPQFQSAGVLVNNGEEHRHNFKGFGQGYGHVMFLNIKELVQPVSIGPGIMGAGFDDTPLRPGIDNARGQKGTVIWCHNNFGHEDVLNALSGRLDALNVFDGSRRGNFEENYYHYLNVGVRLPISTGTDWFMYDFSRVYAEVPGKLTIPRWLDAVKAGRCQASNGPLLTLSVEGRSIGDTIRLAEPKTLTVKASALGRHDFKKLQLVHNGKVVKTAAATGKDAFAANLAHSVRVDEPGWFAVTIDNGPEPAKNELGQDLFAHSSPIYVDFAGRGVFNIEAARALLRQIEEGREAIAAQGTFSSAQAKDKVLALYKSAANSLQERIEQRGR